MLLSQTKIAGVSWILTAALRNGANPDTICMKLHMAISGTYKPQRWSEWSDREFDIAFLIKAIGRPHLLYALQKAEAYPSLTTLQKHQPIHEILVSLGVPVKDEISQNIESVLGKKGRKPPKNFEVRQVFMIDGIAIEQVISFDFK